MLDPRQGGEFGAVKWLTERRRLQVTKRFQLPQWTQATKIARSGLSTRPESVSKFGKDGIDEFPCPQSDAITEIPNPNSQNLRQSEFAAFLHDTLDRGAIQRRFARTPRNARFNEQILCLSFFR